MSKNPAIELNVPIFDTLNGRYITPEAIGADPYCYICGVEEYNEFLDDFEYIGRQLFTRGELERMIRKGGMPIC